ncbi:uncharacterized protein LOC143181557 isoform X2 [Calliopsis andreniformis]|uniref:uncharacterized protein LOC143181557 isoform X2 n=1 Tax=Calliopsis andreniformis TaxID=337506 RepID=UPI003FCE4CE3
MRLLPLRSWTYFIGQDKFLDILTILESKPNVAQKLHNAMVKELYDGMNEDWEDILREGSIQEALEKVSKLSDANSSVYEEVWRPPGNVPLHLRSLDAHKIEEETEKLSKRVQEMEEENVILIEKLTNQRSKMSALYNDMMQSLNKSPLAVQLLEKRLEHLEECLKLLDQ